VTECVCAGSVILGSGIHNRSDPQKHGQDQATRLPGAKQPTKSQRPCQRPNPAPNPPRPTQSQKRPPITGAGTALVTIMGIEQLNSPHSHWRRSPVPVQTGPSFRRSTNWALYRYTGACASVRSRFSRPPSGTRAARRDGGSISRLDQAPHRSWCHDPRSLLAAPPPPVAAKTHALALRTLDGSFACGRACRASIPLAGSGVAT
jgi:hypothetical protein